MVYVTSQADFYAATILIPQTVYTILSSQLSQLIDWLRATGFIALVYLINDLESNLFNAG